jgi:hypothetical protein
MDTDKLLLNEKILYLSDRLRDVQFYDNLEPWRIDTIDFIELQHSAKKIADFLGLTGLTFLISVSKQDKNTAGHIELENSNDVFIEIDSNTNYNDRTILAILSHEICHKYLQLQNIKLIGRENEILTDVAAIYLGLGKLILNGCNSNNNKVGYLERAQYVYLYKLICKSRRVPTDIMLRNLESQIVAEIESCEFNVTYDYYSNDDALQLVNKVIDDSFQSNHKTYAELKKHILIINNLMESLNIQYQDYHKRNFKKKNEWLALINKNYRNESTNFFKNLSVINMITEYWKNERKDNPIALVDFLNEFIYYLNKLAYNSLETTIVKERRIIECPNCNHSMTFSKNIVAKITCKKCSYTFILDNSLYLKKVNTSFEDNSRKKNDKRWINKILPFLK